MDVAEEDNAQVAKRQAIQAIMKDTSLTPQERQKKIQEFMSSGGRGAEASVPAPTPAPVPAPAPPVVSETTPMSPSVSEETSAEASTANAGDNSDAAKRQAIQAIMKDSSLTPQERQTKIQEFMASGGRSAQDSPAVPSPPPAPTPPVETSEALPQSVQTNTAPSSANDTGDVNPEMVKRQAIQAIMKDSSLTPQERQQKIQEFMASGGRGQASAAAPGPAPSTVSNAAATQAPASSQKSQIPTPATSRQALMAAVMKDTSLTPQEKHSKIQEIMASDGQRRDSPGPAPGKPGAPPPSDPPAAVPTPATSRQSLMQQVMNDHTLSPTEKRQKIQEIMKASGGAAGPAATQNTGQASSPGALGTAPRPSGVGAVSSQGADPAARKGARGSTTIAASAATHEAGREPTSPPSQQFDSIMSSGEAVMTPGASAGSRTEDPAARKMRGSSSRTVGTAATAPASLPGASVQALDPAARKSSRGPSSRTASVSSSSGADPAALKIARGSSRTLVSATGTSAPSPQGHMQMANSSSTTASTGQAEGQEISQIRNLETDVLSKTRPEPINAQSTAAAVAPMSTPSTMEQPMDENQNQEHVERAMPVISEDANRHVGLLNAPTSAPEPEEQQDTYAGLNLTGPDIAGADTGGIQAYVAGGDSEDVVGATEVVTEAQIEEEHKQKQTRLIRSGVILLIILTIAIVVPVVVLGGDDGPDRVVNTTDAPSAAPSASPTSSAFADLLEELSTLYGDDDDFEQVIADDSTPQYRAAVWAGEVAPLGLAGDDPRMISRYALATLYFATNGDSWDRCGRGSTTCDEGREWLTAENECDWEAVSCVDPENGDYTVLGITFLSVGGVSNNLDGTLPLDVSFLPNLQDFHISYNHVKGSIPQGWSQLTTLTELLLTGNEFTGAFPDFLVNSNPQLSSIFFTDNRLSGPLPSSMNSASLKQLRLDRNMMSGSIPPEIANLEALEVLYLDGNSMEGSLPEAMYSLANLEQLWLTDNSGMSGVISDSIAGMTSIQQLLLSNTGIGGTIPSPLFNMTQLTKLQLGGGNFSGPLSEGFGQLSVITDIHLENNAFTGVIPIAFDDLPRLRELKLHGNKLTGSISQALCDRKGQSFFDLQNVTADCEGNSPVSCDCCDLCT